MVINYNGTPETVNNIKDCLDLLPCEIAEAIEEFYNENIDFSKEDYESCLEEIQEVAEELKTEVKEAKKLNKNIIIVSLEKIINKIVVM